MPIRAETRCQPHLSITAKSGDKDEDVEKVTGACKRMKQMLMERGLWTAYRKLLIGPQIAPMTSFALVELKFSRLPICFMLLPPQDLRLSCTGTHNIGLSPMRKRKY